MGVQGTATLCAPMENAKFEDRIREFLLGRLEGSIIRKGICIVLHLYGKLCVNLTKSYTVLFWLVVVEDNTI